MNNAYTRLWAGLALACTKPKRNFNGCAPVPSGYGGYWFWWWYWFTAADRVLRHNRLKLGA